jgi:uncharacterized membrane protein YphA (DoxX/SURF4 family)
MIEVKGDASIMSGKGLKVTLWVLQIVAALAILAAGGAKLAGAPQMVAVFEKVGVGQWFRYVTGGLEIVGAVALLVPRSAFYGAALLLAVMAGAVFTHLAVIGGNPAPAVVLLGLTGAIAWLRRPR